jgi:serine/arginine repetitive matrix protein 2
MKLLASMLNSIESTIPTPQPVSPSPPETPELVNPLDSYVDVGRSALAGLADALFGRPQDEIEEEPVHVPSAEPAGLHTETKPFPDPMERHIGGKASEPQTPSSDQRTESEDDQIQQWGHVAPLSDREDGKPQAESVEPLSSLSSLSPSEFPSEASIQETPPTSQTPRPTTDDAELVEDIARRAAEATAALKSVSQTRLEVPSQVARKRPLTKRVALGHISSPQLIAPPSRMNTYTIYSPSSSDLGNAEQRSPSKLSQQMKKFTGSFRGTKSPNGEEVTPWVYNPDSSNSPDEQNPASMDASFTSSGSLPFQAGNSSDDRLRQPATPSTASPLSPGPSLRNLFGRFRKPKRELHIDPFKMSGNDLPPIELTQSRTSEHKGSITSNLLRRPSTSQSGAFLHKRLQAPIPVTSPGSSQVHMKHTEEAQSDAVSSPNQGTDNDEVKKLFAAASNLGLDQAELTRLLSRSASISSHSPGATLLTSPSRTPSESTRPTTIPSSIDENSYSVSRSTSLKKEGKGHRRTPSSTDFGMHTDDSGMIDTDQTITVKRARSGSKRKTSIKKITGAASIKRGQSIYDDPDNMDGAIVRRTLIIPGNGEDGGALAELEGLLQKNAKARKRGSLTSAKTSRDVHDRVPTPPPSRARRFSAGKSSPVPPVPGITTTLASPTFSSFSGISRASESQRGNFDSL